MQYTKSMLMDVLFTQCDFCTESKAARSNFSHGGSCAPISQCEVCEKDVCYRHRFVFHDKYSEIDDYIVTCLNCKKIVEDIWKDAMLEDNCEGYLCYKVRDILEEQKLRK